MRVWRIASAAATALIGVTGVGLVWASGDDEHTMELSAVRGSASGYGFEIQAKDVKGLYLSF